MSIKKIKGWCLSLYMYMYMVHISIIEMQKNPILKTKEVIWTNDPPCVQYDEKKSSIAGIFLVNSPQYTSNLYILHKCTSCIYVQLNFKPNSSYLENWMGCLYNRGTLKAIFCKNDQVQRLVFFVLVIKNQNPTIMYICDICSVDMHKNHFLSWKL